MILLWHEATHRPAMVTDPAPPPETRPATTLLHRADQVCVAAIVAVALALIAASWLYRGGLRERLIEVDRAAPRPLTFRLDVNQADWPEWAQLPGIGETLARRIVAHRARAGRFTRHEELLHVPGIGPKTLARLRPYLEPIPPPAHPQS